MTKYYKRAAAGLSKLQLYPHQILALGSDPGSTQPFHPCLSRYLIAVLNQHTFRISFSHHTSNSLMWTESPKICSETCLSWIFLYLTTIPFCYPQRGRKTPYKATHSPNTFQRSRENKRNQDPETWPTKTSHRITSIIRVTGN